MRESSVHAWLGYYVVGDTKNSRSTAQNLDPKNSASLYPQPWVGGGKRQERLSSSLAVEILTREWARVGLCVFFIVCLSLVGLCLATGGKPTAF